LGIEEILAKLSPEERAIFTKASISQSTPTGYTQEELAKVEIWKELSTELNELLNDLKVQRFVEVRDKQMVDLYSENRAVRNHQFSCIETEQKMLRLKL